MKRKLYVLLILIFTIMFVGQWNTNELFAMELEKSKIVIKQKNEILKDNAKAVINIEFEDKNLYHAIKDQINDNNDESKEARVNNNKERVVFVADDENLKITIDETELAKITILELNYKHITNLTGIEKFIYLKKLDLSYNKIENVNVLNNLTELTYLDLSGNNMPGILGDIPNLTKLETLLLENIGITNLVGMARYINLKKLDLSNNNITNIIPLRKLVNLEEFYISGNKLGNKIDNIKYIIGDPSNATEYPGMMNLKVLDLSKNKFADKYNKDPEKSVIIINKLTNLATLSKLEKLYIANNELVDITGLINLNNLIVLDLSNNKFKYEEFPEDITNNLKNLKELYFSGNSLKYTNGLENLEKLQILDLYNNNIEDLSGLNGLENLKKLKLGENNPNKDEKNLKNLSNLTGLIYLDFSENNIPDILDYILGLTNLETLSLEKNGIETINEQIGKLTNLKVLNLYNNSIQDISNLYSLKNLQELVLGNNNITSLEDMVQDNKLVWENIKKLDLHQNTINANSNINNAILNILKSEIEGLELNYENIVDTSDLPREDNGVYYVTYEDFGARCNGEYDDFIAIRNAHNFANDLYELSLINQKYEKYKNIEVRGKEGSTYHIFKYYSDDDDYANVKTNVNWNNANFIIHDEDIEDKYSRKVSIFKFESTEAGYKTTIANPKWTIGKDTKNISDNIINILKSYNEKGYKKYFCRAVNSSVKQYKRFGDNENKGNSQQDYFVIDSKGNVLNDIQWDFTKITSFEIYPIPENKMEIGNGKFITNNTRSGNEYSNNARNLHFCNSSNLHIYNIEHSLDKDVLSGSYNSFILVENGADIEITDCKLFARKYSLTRKSTYDLGLMKVVNGKCKYIISDNINDQDRWGINGSNYCKDILFEKCTLNRIDAHCGVYNLTIKECNIGYHGLTMNGQGNLNIIKTTVTSDAFVALREDYGSTWNGNVNIIDCKYRYNKANLAKILSFEYAWDDSDHVIPHDFGYDCKFPNVYVENINIEYLNETQYAFTAIIGNGEVHYPNDIPLDYWPSKIFINGYEFSKESKELVKKACKENKYGEYEGEEIEPFIRFTTTTFEPTSVNCVITKCNIETEDHEDLTHKFNFNEELITNKNISLKNNLKVEEFNKSGTQSLDKDYHPIKTTLTDTITIYKNGVELEKNEQGMYKFEDEGKYKIQIKTTQELYDRFREDPKSEYYDTSKILEGTKEFEFTIDKTAPILDVKYSTNDNTYTEIGVIVTINSNEELKELNGWVLSKDKRTLTKIYRKNTDNPEIIKIFDIAGNEANVEIKKITNITNGKIQNAIQETAYSYYMRGINLQYNQPKGIHLFRSPEETTEQNKNYTICSGFTKNVYYDLFRIKIPGTTSDLLKYSREKITRNEVIAYGKRDESGNICMKFNNTENEIKNPSLENDIIPCLKIGDVITYTGHTMMVYDLVYDDNGNVIDALIMESGTWNSKQINSKTYRPFYYHNDLNLEWNDGQVMGTIRVRKLSTMDAWANFTKEEYSILRFVQIDNEGNMVLNYYDNKITNPEIIHDYNKEKVNLLKKVEDRIKYSRLYIEKTIDVHADDIVEEGDVLTYKIIIKNNSDEAYKDNITITENISEFVTYKNESMKVDGVSKNLSITTDGDGTTTLSYNIGKINSKQEVIIEYSVKVNENTRGNIIESTGSVENIKSATVKNIIGKNLNNNQVNNIKTLINTQTNSANFDEIKLTDDSGNEIKDENGNSVQATGKELINEIYKQKLGFNIKLNELNLTDLIKIKNGNISIDDNKFSNYILNGYWNRTYITYSPDVESKPQVQMIFWNSENEQRADTIYKENFKTGDILVYNNSNDINGSKQITYEDGEYAYIYIEGKGFIGINYGNDGIKGNKDDRNEFNANYYEGDKENGNGLYVFSDKNETDAEFLEFANYQTLLGKDCYVILRPALAMYNINYELDGGENNSNNPSMYLKGDVIKLQDPTKEGYIFEGWYLDSEYTNKIIKLEGITNDVKLYAKWRLPETTQITIKNEPEKVTYIKGEDLDLTGGKIEVTYENGETEEKDITEEMVSGYNKDTLGEQEIIVTYEGKEATFKVEVTNKVVSIEVTTLPEKITYVKGEELNLTGGKIEITYENGDKEEKDITTEMVTGYDNAKLGEQELIVTYEEKTATFKVEVKKGEEEIFVDLNGYEEEKEEETTYLTKVQPKTTIEKIESAEEGIKTNGKIEIWNGDTEVEDKESTIGTGYRIVIKDKEEKVVKEYVVSVKGDCNGDSKADFKDMLKINKHRLNKVKLQGEYLKAGEINGDSKVDFKDMLKINKFRLNKITEL